MHSVKDISHNHTLSIESEDSSSHDSLTIAKYSRYFSSLTTAKRNGKSAPHKAIMLLSVLDLIEAGRIADGLVKYNQDLLNHFNANWTRYVGDNNLFKPVPSTPYWHLSGEPFWSLHRTDGGSLESIKGTPGSSTIRDLHIEAELDSELFDILKDDAERNRFRELLIKTYLS